MAHTMTLLTRVRVRRGSLDQSKDRVDGDVIYLLRVFTHTLPRRHDAPLKDTQPTKLLLELRSAHHAATGGGNNGRGCSNP